MSINKVMIAGNLTRSPELRRTQGGTAVLTFGVAVNDRRKNPQTGDWEDYPNYVDCALFGKRADTVSKFIDKGSKVAIEGSLRYSSWEKDGHKRSKLEVIVDEIEFLSRHGDSKAHNQSQNQQTANYTNQPQNGAYSGSQQPAGYPPQGYQQPYQPQQGYYPQPQAPTADVYADSDIPF